MGKFTDWLKHSFSIFKYGNDPPDSYISDRFEVPISGTSYSYRPDKTRLTKGNDRSIINAIFNRIALDVASISIEHVQLDENGRFIEKIDSSLNECLTVSANIDQTSRAFIQDIVLSMFDEGCVAVVPVETTLDPIKTGSFDILSMRTGKIVEWMPKHVKVNVYNELTGKREDIILPKSTVAIIENPLYSVMNEPNSTLKRLVRKMNLIDAVDEQSGSGKLDLIIQLPYIIKSDARKKQAEMRRKEIEEQLAGSKYGIAYTDGTEHVTQLNRPAENNLFNQIEYLTKLLYSQLGITDEIMNGTASESAMINYQSRTIEVIVSAIVNEFKRKFLTKTARTQGKSIVFFKDQFKLVSSEKIADIADKFTRNEIMTSNEIRQIVGMKPSKDPNADELRNKNLNKSNEEIANGPKIYENDSEKYDDSSDGFGNIADLTVDELLQRGEIQNE